MKLRIDGGLGPDESGYEEQQAMLAVFEDCFNLQKMKSSTYGKAWQSQGYMGNLARVLSKISRIKNMLWRDDSFDSTTESQMDNARDIVNIMVFFIINRARNNKWGISG